MDGRIKKPVANRVIEKVKIRLDGREWPLIVNHNLLCDLEDMTGANVLFGADNIAKPSAKMIRALLYLCLREQGAEYTLQQVGELITAANLHLVTKGIIEAWVASMPRKEDIDAETGETGELKAVG